MLKSGVAGSVPKSTQYNGVSNVGSGDPVAPIDLWVLKRTGSIINVR